VSFFLWFVCLLPGKAQCLSSANPVGGIENLMTLEKKTLRFISFYKYGQTRHYFEGNQPSDFNLISKAYYNYLSLMAGHGFGKRLTVEAELGYYINKSQVYNIDPPHTLTGRGFSNIKIIGKYNILQNHVKRAYYTAGIGARIPCSTTPKYVDNIELPTELQPTLGSYGFIFHSAFVKEYPASGLRIFITNRIETGLPNKDDYQLGTVFFNSLFISKHLMSSRLRNDWTAIFQLRNEVRMPDKISAVAKEASGSCLLYLVPQINYVHREKWNISALIDIPLYQKFRGIQLSAGVGFTLVFTRSIKITKKEGTDEDY